MNDRKNKKHLFQKNFYVCFIDYIKVFNCVDHNKLWKILQEMGIPDHLTCLLRNLCAGQEATVRTRHGQMDWFQIGTGVRQGCMSSSCLFNFYTEYIMWNVRLDEAQAGIKTAGRNINNLRYAYDTALMAENEEEPWWASWWGWKRRVIKLAWNSTFKKRRSWHPVPWIHGIQSHEFMANRWGNNGNGERLYFLGLQNHCGWWQQPWN